MSIEEGAEIDRFAGRVFDAILVCVVVAGVFGGIFLHYEPTVRAAQEEALRMELMNIRTAINLYQIRRGHPPQDLRELLRASYLVPGAHGTVFVPSYLQNQVLDHDGLPVDPFGHRFEYDATRAMVRSATRNYQNW